MKLVVIAVVVAVLAGVWAYIDRGTAQLLIPLLTAGGIAGAWCNRSSRIGTS
jgi:hypothetical protein